MSEFCVMVVVSFGGHASTHLLQWGPVARGIQHLETVADAASSPCSIFVWWSYTSQIEFLQAAIHAHGENDSASSALSLRLTVDGT